MKKCLNCNKELSKSQTKYCSNKCQVEYQRKEYIERWKNGQEDGVTGQFGTSHYIRSYLFEKNNNSCELCGWGKVNPFTNTIPLEIHHIDGDYRNNSEKNLQLLCPNCHSLTENIKGANKNGRGEERNKYKPRKNYCIDCGEPIGIDSTRCRSCAAKIRITEKPVSREELKFLIRSLSFVAIGEKYGVSDNAIRKWCINYSLPSKKKDINAYSDEEWALI